MPVLLHFSEILPDTTGWCWTLHENDAVQLQTMVSPHPRRVECVRHIHLRHLLEAVPTRSSKTEAAKAHENMGIRSQNIPAGPSKPKPTPRQTRASKIPTPATPSSRVFPGLRPAVPPDAPLPERDELKMKEGRRATSIKWTNEQLEIPTFQMYPVVARASGLKTECIETRVPRFVGREGATSSFQELMGRICPLGPILNTKRRRLVLPANWLSARSKSLYTVSVGLLETGLMLICNIIVQGSRHLKGLSGLIVLSH
ncbi:hypothetical protein PG997_000636 [Apiospora hydei]|uniref:Uncharacterized protein n=1 Tax=Apiospora hydei TaxID=1337664 RepID=A0ABR1XB62_9PEZI